MNRRAIILVMDSFGMGATPDADRFGDAGADTFGHIARACHEQAAAMGRLGPLDLPHLFRLGLGAAYAELHGGPPPGMSTAAPPAGAYGCAAELSSGKDTPSGHWEMAGVPVMFEWGYFRDPQQSFPEALLAELVRRGDLPGVLGNCHASGTTILEELGEEHVRTGKPIVYTSADSVFQIACHEESFGLQSLYDLCGIARELVDEYRIGRVIARPFQGEASGGFRRTGNRRDLSVPPPAPTVLDRLTAAGGSVISIGKIADIFAHRGISRKIKANGLNGLFNATLGALGEAGPRSLVFTNFVDFDQSYGHRRDVAGYAEGLEQFDARLPELLQKMEPGDLLVITADHGCDPTWSGTDHTREHVPVLVSGPGIAARSLGRRESFADIGQTLAEYFGLAAMDHGESFLPELGLEPHGRR